VFLSLLMFTRHVKSTLKTSKFNCVSCSCT
jgi:hypothetical protein